MSTGRNRKDVGGCQRLLLIKRPKECEGGGTASPTKSVPSLYVCSCVGVRSESAIAGLDSGLPSLHLLINRALRAKASY